VRVTPNEDAQKPLSQSHIERPFTCTRIETYSVCTLYIPGMGVKGRGSASGPGGGEALMWERKAGLLGGGENSLDESVQL
jgi:hypothetical protein